MSQSTAIEIPYMENLGAFWHTLYFAMTDNEDKPVSPVVFIFQGSGNSGITSFARAVQKFLEQRGYSCSIFEECTGKIPFPRNDFTIYNTNVDFDTDVFSTFQCTCQLIHFPFQIENINRNANEVLNELVGLINSMEGI